MAGERERRAEEERIGLERPGGEGGDEASGVEGIFVFVGGIGVDILVDGGEIGGDETERVVLSSEVEEMVVLRLSLLHDTAARGALCD